MGTLTTSIFMIISVVVAVISGLAVDTASGSESLGKATVLVSFMFFLYLIIIARKLYQIADNQKARGP